MCGFTKQLNLLSLGMLVQGGYIPVVTAKLLALEPGNATVTVPCKKGLVSYLPILVLHDKLFRVGD
ncbi:MAG: hypothetical protein ACREPN_07025 [Rudaea sp.]